MRKERLTCERFVIYDHANYRHGNGTVKRVSSHDLSTLNSCTYTAPSPNTPVIANLRRMGRCSFQI